MDSQKFYKIQTEFKRGFALHYLLLYSIVCGLETKNSYEFGTGLSTEVILNALKETGGRHTSCSKTSREEICEGSLKDNTNWTHHHMISSEALRLLEDDELFDFVLHDGSHNGKIVAPDLVAIVPHMKQYSMILVHDTQHSKSGHSTFEAVVKGLRGVPYSFTTLPYGYGLTIVRIEGNSQNGQVVITRKKESSEHVTKPF